MPGRVIALRAPVVRIITDSEPRCKDSPPADRSFLEQSVDEEPNTRPVRHAVFIHVRRGQTMWIRVQAEQNIDNKRHIGRCRQPVAVQVASDGEAQNEQADLVGTHVDLVPD